MIQRERIFVAVQYPGEKDGASVERGLAALGSATLDTGLQRA